MNFRSRHWERNKTKQPTVSQLLSERRMVWTWSLNALTYLSFVARFLSSTEKSWWSVHLLTPWRSSWIRLGLSETAPKTTEAAAATSAAYPTESWTPLVVWWVEIFYKTLARRGTSFTEITWHQSNSQYFIGLCFMVWTHPFTSDTIWLQWMPLP